MSLTSSAAQVIISVIPIVGISMGSVVIFFYLLWSHREKVLLINKDRYEPARIDLDTFALLAGILLGAVGAILTILLAAMEGLKYGLLGGLIPLGLGLGLLAFFRIRNPRDKE